MAAIILIALGIVAPEYQSLANTTEQKAAEVALLNVPAERTTLVPLLPIVGAVAMASGIWLLLIRKKNLTLGQVQGQENASPPRKSGQSVR